MRNLFFYIRYIRWKSSKIEVKPLWSYGNDNIVSTKQNTVNRIGLLSDTFVMSCGIPYLYNNYVSNLASKVDSFLMKYKNREIDIVNVLRIFYFTMGM